MLRGIFRLLTGLIAIFHLCVLFACSQPVQSVTPGSTPQPSATMVVALETEPVIGTPDGIDPASRWIEVDLSRQKVFLHDSDRVIAEYLAATGVADPPQFSTYQGIFQVQIMLKGPVESVSGVYVSNIVEFDLERGNAIHSLPMNKDGQILDNRLGRPVTAGCVRVAESEAIFEFARIGMKVWVH